MLFLATHYIKHKQYEMEVLFRILGPEEVQPPARGVQPAREPQVPLRVVPGSVRRTMQGEELLK